MSNMFAGKTESDPTGRDPHQPGAKLDADKPRPGLVLNGFAPALMAVTEVGTYGARKYTDNGWKDVPNGVERYTDAMHRHLLAEAAGELRDKDTGILHAAHAAWNALARLDLLIRGKPGEARLPAKIDPEVQATHPAQNMGMKCDHFGRPFGMPEGASHYNGALGEGL